MRIPPPTELGVAAAFIALMAGTGWLVERTVAAPPPPTEGSDAEVTARLTADCARGEPAGCANLGVLYATGRGVARDDVMAAKLYERACTAGHARACSNLGALHAQGRGVPRDDRRAIELFRRACTAGETAACENLRRMGQPPPD